MKVRKIRRGTGILPVRRRVWHRHLARRTRRSFVPQPCWHRQDARSTRPHRLEACATRRTLTAIVAAAVCHAGPLLAALSRGPGATPQPNPTPPGSQTPAATPLLELKDIAPPVDVFGYPLWLVATIAAAALLVIATIIAFVIWLLTRRPKPVQPPPTPYALAIAALDEARSRLNETDPYAFSILVSDILRNFVSAQYALPATQQTSPEFLNAAAASSRFSAADKSLLGEFLDKCDLIKFARVNATREDSAALLDQAVRFVAGSAEGGATR
jgi:hypothetical protein